MGPYVKGHLTYRAAFDAAEGACARFGGGAGWLVAFRASGHGNGRSVFVKTYPSFASFLLGTVEQLLGVWGVRGAIDP